jgi:23S rRNA (guanine2445-N2)-methyltransferase / 23S rRNA (guanine2069-N7)-methyltransferase
MEFFATCPRAIEPILTEELEAIVPLGATAVRPATGGVGFDATLEGAYRVCLWSRVANRVLFPLSRAPAPSPEALYDAARTIAWREHLSAKQTFAVDFTQIRSPITHTHFGALKVKDAIVDQLREQTGARPSVDTANPEVRVYAHAEGEQVTIGIDLAGPLHRRGWRARGAEAPLKENLAAAILLLAGWPARAAQGAPLVDPMCGSGTLLVEAAYIATDRAPGLLRQPRGTPGGWRGHDAALFGKLHAEARARARAQLPDGTSLWGWDADERAVRLARENLRRAGVEGMVTVDRRELDALAPPVPRQARPGRAQPGWVDLPGGRPGLVVTNPPYGERLGDASELGPLYSTLGDLLRRRFPGWDAFVLTGNLELGKRIGLRPRRRIELWNGPIECRLYELPISTEAPREEGPAWRRPRPPSPAAEMFKNRLAKNLRHLRKWARREDVHCFRVYDADLPEYAVAVDVYEDAAHVQEYECPPTVDARAAEQRLHDVMAVVPEVLGVEAAQVFLKVRRRQRGLEQYQKLGSSGAEKVVREGAHRFLVNLSDYLDTGLFLDDRLLRQRIAEEAPGKRFLNLFSYTGTATVYAARGGARSSLSVDLSNTYLAWAQRNFELNRLDGRAHRNERADVLAWLERTPRPSERFELAFCAPPTFSKSKSMRGTFDVQRDHVDLVRAIVRQLSPSGVLFFSTHLRTFKLDRSQLAHLKVEDWSHRTLPEDFKRHPRIHHTFRIAV